MQVSEHGLANLLPLDCTITYWSVATRERLLNSLQMLTHAEKTKSPHFAVIWLLQSTYLCDVIEYNLRLVIEFPYDHHPL